MRASIDPCLKCLAFSCALVGGSASPSWAQDQTKSVMPGREAATTQTAPPPMAMPPMVMPGKKPPPMPSMGAAPGTSALPPPRLYDRKGWPSPTADDEKFSFLLFDNLEYRRIGGENALRWDILGWQGGDYQRIWFKSEGLQSVSRRAGGEADVQLLRGNLISPYFDLQYGLRVAGRWGDGPGRARVYGVIGLQGLAPYRFDIEPTLFLSPEGKLSGRFTGTYDVLLSQRLILQPRLETEFALQKDEAFRAGSGLNNTELGFRLRYEIRRGFAPYVGATWLRSYGGTADLVRRGGGNPSQFLGVTGVRMWF